MGSGVEVVNGFQFGTDLLNLSLGSISASDFSCSDITVNGNAAVALTVSDDPSRGVILMTPGLSAADLQNDHLFIAGTHILVS